MRANQRIVITGMGSVSCHGTDSDIFYQKLLSGESGVEMIERFANTTLPTKFGAQVRDFNPADFLDPKMARRADLCIQFGYAAGKLAIQNAKLDPNAVDGERAGVLIGSGMGGMETFTQGTVNYHKGGYRKVTPFFVPFILTDMPGAYLAVDLNFRGPNYSISTACATANYSIINAANHIRMGHADVMLAGGTETGINEVCVGGFSAMKALSRNEADFKGASKPWDKSRDGFVVGEGAGVFVLETLEHALNRGAPILAEYKGGAFTCDAFHMTEPRTDGSEVARCMRLAMQDGGVEPKDIDYINAHATSTPVGDKCELRAVQDVFGPTRDKIRMNATKSLIGHGLGCSGALELVAVIKAIETGKLHPTINLKEPEDELEGIDVVLDVAQDWNVDFAISNSFGFGGHNASLVVGKYEK